MKSIFSSFRLVTGLTIGIAAAIALIFSILISYIYFSSSSSAIENAKLESLKKVELIHHQVTMFEQNLTDQATQLLSLFEAAFPETVFLDQTKTIQTGQFNLPTLMIGGKSINNQTDQIDYYSKLAGDIPASFFVRQGDTFVRVASTLKKQDGSRSTGSVLDNKHPGYSAIVKGETYIGRAKLFEKDYIAGYKPIKDAEGNIIALFAIAFDFSKKLLDLENYLADLELEGRSYVFVMSTKEGNDQGKLVIHPFLKGKNLAMTADADGNYPFKNMLTSEQGNFEYKFQENDKVQSKILAFTTFDKWDWSLGIISYTDDVTENALAIRNTILAIAVISLILLVAVSFFLIRKTLSPINLAQEVMHNIGKGDLRDQKDQNSIVNDSSRNEIIGLLISQQKMKTSLKDLIQGLLVDISNINNASCALEKVVTNNNNIVEEQKDASAVVASSISEMAESITDIAASASETENETRKALDSVTEGRELISQSNNIAKSSATQMEEVNEVITHLHDQTLNIGNILDVIGGIAEQTNLLALNAAIEAARAGEQGRGFAVVADEVRNLAKATQKSTLQIQELIETLQTSAKSAVAKVNNAGEINQQNVECADKVFSTLNDISTNTQNISDRITQIATTTEQQSTVVKQIEANMAKLQSSGDNLAASAYETARTGSDIQNLSQSLDGKVSKFIL